MKRIVFIAIAFLIVVSAAFAATFALTKTAETNNTISFSWQAQSGADGYRFYAPGKDEGSSCSGKAVSRTFDPTKTTVKFAKVDGSYCVEAIKIVPVGSAIYPIATPPPPPPENLANIWVDANGGTCRRNSAHVVYGDAEACPSFLAAYAAATSGDTIGVTGTLGIQKFAGGYQSSQGSGTKTLTFKGATGNKVKQIHFGSPNLTFDGINVDYGTVPGQVGAAFENGGDPFTFKNGSIGGVVDEKGALVTGSGIVFDSVIFHDVLIRTNGVHNECIWAGVPEGMIVRNSRFENCATMDIFFTYPDYWTPLPPPYGNVTLENNWFGVPRDGGGSPRGYSLYIAKNGVSLSNQTPMSGWRVRNNYVEPGSYGVTSDQPMGSNNIFCGNSGNVPSSWSGSC